MLVFLILLGLASIFLPKSVSYQNSIYIKTSKEIPIEQIARIDKWQNWFELFSMDSTLDYTISEELYGIGSAINYTSKNPKIQNGSIELTDIMPNQMVEALINCNNLSNFTLNFTSNDTVNGCIISAGYTNSDLSFVEKYIQFLYKSENEAFFDKSLTSLKRLSEKIKYSRTGLAYQIEIPVNKVILLSDSCSKSAIKEKISKLNSSLTWYFKYKKIEKPKDYFLVYHQWKDTSKMVFSVGYMVNDFVKTYGKYKYIEFDSLTIAATVDYYGLPGKIDIAFSALENYIDKENLATGKSIWLMNILNENNEPDTCKWTTKLFSPIKK